MGHRDADPIVSVSVETRPAVIDFDDILDAVEVGPDDGYSDRPWDNFTGFDHELRLPRTDSEADSEACIYHDGRYRVFDVPDDTDFFNCQATGLGFEPRQTGPKPVVLPLHYPVKDVVFCRVKFAIAKIVAKSSDTRFDTGYPVHHGN